MVCEDFLLSLNLMASVDMRGAFQMTWVYLIFFFITKMDLGDWRKSNLNLSEHQVLALYTDYQWLCQILPSQGNALCGSSLQIKCIFFIFNCFVN